MSAHLSDELLAAHADGTLSPIDREAADAHLDVCAQCREELRLAGAGREALRALPSELRPPIDVAARIVGGRRGPETGPETGRESRPSDGAPRWYRAAVIVGVAAAIGLAALIVPNLADSGSEDRGAQDASAPNASAVAGGDASTGGSGQSSEDTTASSPSLSFASAGRIDDDELGRLLADPDRPEALAATGSEVKDSAALRSTALGCLRSAAGEALPADVVPVRVLDAIYRGTPAVVGVYASTSDDGGTILFVAAHEGCRLLASGSSATGVVTPTE
jgi:hypothetical protein